MLGQPSPLHQKEAGVLGPFQRPGVFRAPVTTVRQAAVGVAPSRPAAHDEYPDRWLLGPGSFQTLEPVIEEGQTVRVIVLAQVAIHRRMLTEVNIAGIADGTRAVGPRPHDQGYGPFLDRG